MHHRLVPMLMLVACTAPAPEPDAIELPAEVEPESAGVAQVPEMEVVPASDSPQRRSGPLDVTPRRAGDGVLPDRPRARLDAEIGSMMDSIEMFGWTPDSQRFEHCHPNGGRGGYNCESHGVDGSKSAFDDSSREEEVDAKKNRAIQARMRALVHDAKTWAWGGELELVWRDRPGDEKRRGVVEVGVRVRDSDVKVFPVRLQLEEFAMGHLELVIPSPDGEHLALVAHGFAGEFSDTFATRIIAVDELAAAAFAAR